MLDNEPQTLARRAWAEHTRACLALLPAAQEIALRLSYDDRLCSPEIALRMEVSIAEVRTALADGLRSLGRLLLKAAPGP